MKIFGTDFDGVIINIEPEKSIAFENLVNKEWGLDMDKNEAAKFWLDTGGTSRRYKFDYLHQKKFNTSLSDKEYKAIENKFSGLLKTKFYPTVQLLPGALDLLNFVRANFDFTFVSTGMSIEEIKFLIQALGLSKYFDLILGTNETFVTKRDHFKKILDEQKPDLLVFVADGIKDMEMAKEFNAKTIGVTTNHSKEELEKAGAEITCESPQQVIPILKSLLNQ